MPPSFCSCVTRNAPAPRVMVTPSALAASTVPDSASVGQSTSAFTCQNLITTPSSVAGVLENGLNACIWRNSVAAWHDQSSAVSLLMTFSAYVMPSVGCSATWNLPHYASLASASTTTHPPSTTSVSCSVPVMSVRLMGTRLVAIMSLVSRSASIYVNMMPGSVPSASVARRMNAAPHQRDSSSTRTLM